MASLSAKFVLWQKTDVIIKIFFLCVEFVQKISINPYFVMIM